nr:hypothetical protein HmN_000948600 [Hymenolepis microstoma]
MKLFMDMLVRLCEFPFSYADISTNSRFSRSELHELLQSNGVDNKGLWKYLFSTSGWGPGDELNSWFGIIYEAGSVEWSRSADASSDAYLRAYVIPECAKAMSTRQYLIEDSGSDQLVHSIREKKTFQVHLIGVETELDLLPVFKQLDDLISPNIERINIKMIGPNISPRASYKTWLLSSRMSVFVWRGVYHEFMEEFKGCQELTFADIVIGFNVGFIAYPTWKQTLELLKDLKFPAFFTDSCPYSCMWNLKTLQSLGLCSEFDIDNAEKSLSLFVFMRRNVVELSTAEWKMTSQQ